MFDQLLSLEGKKILTPFLGSLCTCLIVLKGKKKYEFWFQGKEISYSMILNFQNLSLPPKQKVSPQKGEEKKKLKYNTQKSK